MAAAARWRSTTAIAGRPSESNFGAPAGTTSRRVSAERLRKIRVYNGPADPCYISADFRLQEGHISRLTEAAAVGATVLLAIAIMIVLGYFCGWETFSGSSVLSRDWFWDAGH